MTQEWLLLFHLTRLSSSVLNKNKIDVKITYFNKREREKTSFLGVLEKYICSVKYLYCYTEQRTSYIVFQI